MPPVEAVVFVIVTFPLIVVVPPTFKFPATPAPPETTKAPVVVEEDAVVAVIEADLDSILPSS